MSDRRSALSEKRAKLEAMKLRRSTSTAKSASTNSKSQASSKAIVVGIGPSGVDQLNIADGRFQSLPST